MSRIDQAVAEDGRLLGRAENERLCHRVAGFARDGGTTDVRVVTWWSGELRWARNQVSLASDRKGIIVMISRELPGHRRGNTSTNQLDSTSLEDAVRGAERAAALQPPLIDDMPMLAPEFVQPVTTVWSDPTFNVTAETRGGLASVLTKQAAEQKMLSAGYLEMHGGEIAQLNATQRFRYERGTQAQCSMTVRHPKGTGSGWAGQSGYDWTAINGPALAERALQKCLASIDPVRIEPGRYTVILEPQAVADLIRALVPGALDREDAEVYRSGPFVLGVDEGLMLIRTKLGLKVIDERITISHNPSDPELGVMNANGLEPLTWIERGVLKTLNYNRAYALPWLNDNTGAWMRESFRMSGGNTPIEEMISTTKRGILVTRLSNMLTLERNSLLATGVTRDGLWLIEHGKVSKAINNLRLTDSPLFMLNQVEQLGVPVPVFRPVRNASWVALTPAIVPPIKANDFSFTALVDAV